MLKKPNPVFYMILTAFLLFTTCITDSDNGNGEEDSGPGTFHWTFQGEIPGWKPFINASGFTPDFPANPNGTTMALNATYVNGMTLLASQRTTRWIPDGSAPAGSGFSIGYVMPNGRANTGIYSLKIDNVKGPFELTINYIARETQRSFPIIFINGVEVLRGEETDANTPKTITCEYEEDDIVTIQLGNDRNPSDAYAGIKFYDIILSGPNITNGDDREFEDDGSGDNGDNGGDDGEYNYFDDTGMILAFPGAEGFGRYARGGRGGKVVAVTNLLDNAANPPAGSLRWALAQHPGEPITVVFRVSGNIALERYVSNSQRNELRVNRTNFTIAGQTSPGGISISGNKVNFGGSSHFIIRHVRFRIGGTNQPNGSIGIENASHFIIDQCSFGWSGEEVMTVYDNRFTTVQWCIVHEGLFESGHDKGRRGYGTQWGGERATYHHNLLAHHDSRSPRFNGARSNTDRNVLIDFVNNVNYNWGKWNSSYGGENSRSTHHVNFVNNYFKPGPAFPHAEASAFVQVYYGTNKTVFPLWYMSGNIMEGDTAKNANNYLGMVLRGYPAGTTVAHLTSPEPFEIKYPVTTQTAQAAYTSVLARAGAFPRDSADTRIVNNVRNGTAGISKTAGRPGIIDDPSDVGGYPTYSTPTPPVDTDGDGIPDDWELANGLNPSNPADGNSTNLCPDGKYTNLEIYLNWLEAQIRNQ